MLTHECKGNASYKHLSIKHENIDLYYKNKPRIFATVPKYRKELGLSQERLAELAGVHRTYIGMVERAEKNITLCNIEKIAKALNVEIKDLFLI